MDGAHIAGQAISTSGCVVSMLCANQTRLSAAQYGQQQELLFPVNASNTSQVLLSAPASFSLPLFPSASLFSFLQSPQCLDLIPMGIIIMGLIPIMGIILIGIIPMGIIPTGINLALTCPSRPQVLPAVPAAVLSDRCSTAPFVRCGVQRQPRHAKDQVAPLPKVRPAPTPTPTPALH